MNSSLLQILVLAGIAAFLIYRLANVLGRRDGFEPSRRPAPRQEGAAPIDITPERDDDILDHVASGSPAEQALMQMKQRESSFAVNEFLQGARGAYEMILMGFEAGRLDELRPFLSNEVYESFAHVIEERKRQGLQIEAHFVGLRELVLQDANFDSATDVGEVTVRFVGELTYVVRDATGAIVEGDEKTVKRQADVWTFARQMGANDPNWQLVGTGE